jgi:hypothetical protein
MVAFIVGYLLAKELGWGACLAVAILIMALKPQY